MKIIKRIQEACYLSLKNRNQEDILKTWIFSDRGLSAPAPVGSKHEHADLRGDSGRAGEAPELRQQQQPAFGAQHVRNEPDLPGNRKVRKRDWDIVRSNAIQQRPAVIEVPRSSPVFHINDSILIVYDYNRNNFYMYAIVLDLPTSLATRI